MDRSQCDHLFICPLVTHHTDSLYGQQHCKRLTDLVVDSGLADFFDVDAIGLLEDLDLLASNGTEDPNSETGAGEGMTLDKVGGDREEATESPNLIY